MATAHTVMMMVMNDRQLQDHSGHFKGLHQKTHEAKRTNSKKGRKILHTPLQAEAAKTMHFRKRKQLQEKVLMSKE